MEKAVVICEDFLEVTLEENDLPEPDDPEEGFISIVWEDGKIEGETE